MEPLREPAVMSVIDTNMFVVQRWPTGGKDPIIIRRGVVLGLYSLCCLFIMATAEG